MGGIVVIALSIIIVAVTVVSVLLSDSTSKRVTIGIIGGISLLVLLLVKMVYTIDQAEEGIIMRFGRIRAVEVTPGIHFKNIIDNVVKVPTSIQHFDTTYHFVNKDGLKITVDATVYYRFPTEKEKVVKLYKQTKFHDVKRYIAPASEMGIKVSMNYSTEELYNPQTREQISQKAKENIHLPVDVELVNVVVRRIGLPPGILQAITKKLEMQQEIERKQFEIKKEKMEAERKRVEAEGIAKANKIIGQSLTKNYVGWYALEVLKEFAKSKNNTIIVVPQNLTQLPMILPQK